LPTRRRLDVRGRRGAEHTVDRGGALLRGTTRHITRLVSPRWIFRTIDRFGPMYARIALDVPWVPLPRGVGQFLDQIATLRGEPPTAEERRQLAASRLAFLLTRKVVYLVRQAWPLSQARSRLPPIDVDGLHHHEAALEGGGGAVLVTAHFGFPVLVGPVLAARGIDVVGAGAASSWVDESFLGDVWDRARTLRQLQARLTGPCVCLFLPDSRRGAGIEVPVLAARLKIGLGAFVLAQEARRPVLPVFAVRRPAIFHSRPSARPAGCSSRTPADSRIISSAMDRGSWKRGLEPT
jgi:hypothetical protein